MRNLALVSQNIISLGDSTAIITATSIDLDNSVLYSATEHHRDEDTHDIQIWRIPLNPHKGTYEKSSAALWTMFSTMASSLDLAHVVSLRVIPDTRQLSVITRDGNITTITLDDEEPFLDVEGTIDGGIRAAAWSPDDSLLVIVTGEEKLLLMTSSYDVISEVPVHSAEFGEDAPINVGWGSKQTQFHGSLGKAAATQTSTTLIGSSPDDDGLPRISWRGDASAFVVSSLTQSSSSSTHNHRILRTYAAQPSATLQSTSEAVPGLEHVMAWKPSGNLIAGTQRFGGAESEGLGKGREGRHDVVFFERNGLRHGEFGINVGVLSGGSKNGAKRWGYRVRELSWSPDSSVLSLWIEGEDWDVVQLWTTGNYHWYLKQELVASVLTSSGANRFTSVTWHAETPLRLFLCTSGQVMERTYTWDTVASSRPPPYDSGLVSVVDGSSILLTPFRVQNVPPPMSSYQLSLANSIGVAKCIPIDMSHSPEDAVLAVLWEAGRVELWDLKVKLTPSRGTVLDPKLLLESSCAARSVRQILLINGGLLAILGTSQDGCDTISTIVGKGEPVAEQIIHLPSANGRMFASTEELSWQAADGEIFDVDISQQSFSSTAHFPEFCFSSKRIVLFANQTTEATPVTIFIGLEASGKLYLTTPMSSCAQVIAINASSFTLSSAFLVFTTNAHEGIFIPLHDLSATLSSSANSEEIDVNSVTAALSSRWDKRRIERGSRIVVAIPSTMSLVLQMPRGNLETINPRPLVMEVVRQDLDCGNYGKAFSACRKHRIDLNVLVDHDRQKFLQNLSAFVEQVSDVDQINLFITSIGRGTQTPEMVAELCDALRLHLELMDTKKYVNSILTAYVVKTPPDHEAGLGMLLRLRETNPELVEDAVKYIIFLVDANTLYDVALGMYDFSLVLLVAQHAQKDPREYLPFLQELRALEKFYQRFKIDDHLRKHEGALRNLSLSGPEHFEEALTYIEKHQLYDAALSIWSHTDRHLDVLSIYGDWLFERRELRQAAAVFLDANNKYKAMVALEKALQWQDLFTLAIDVGTSEEDLISMGYRVADDLSTKKRYAEAAQVLLDHAKDVREAVVSLVHGNLFSEARRIIGLHGPAELLTEIVYPGSLESCATLQEDITEMKEQLGKQGSRLTELRQRKVEEPDAFCGVEDANLHNVDVMTDVSAPVTTYTRYTVAPTTASRSSRRTSRSKRKMERKVGSGRKGTVDEEEYLLNSVTKLVARCGRVQEEMKTLLPHLARFTEEHRTEGISLQHNLESFEVELKTALDQIWEKPVEDHTTVQNSWSARLEEQERAGMIDAIKKVPKPEMLLSQWSLRCFQS